MGHFSLSLSLSLTLSHTLSLSLSRALFSIFISRCHRWNPNGLSPAIEIGCVCYADNIAMGSFRIRMTRIKNQWRWLAQKAANSRSSLCHAHTLIKIKVQKTSVDNGKTWSPIELVVQSHLQVSGHAGMSSAPWALTDDVTGEMFLFYNANSTGNRRCDCGVAAVTSTDNGVSWSSTPTAVYPESSGFYGSSLATGVTLKVGEHKGRLVTCK